MGGTAGTIHAGVDSIVSKDMRAAPLGSTQVAESKRVRVAPPGEAEPPIVRVLPLHNDGGVSRLIEIICEQ